MNQHFRTPRGSRVARVARVCAAWIALCALPMAVQAEELGTYTGAQLYQRFCASCHGKEARGDGPVASTLKSMVPDLTQLAQRRGGQFPKDLVRRVIDGREIRAPHGSRAMPVWGLEFWEAQGANEAASQQSVVLVDRLVDYLASIQRKP